MAAPARKAIRGVRRPFAPVVVSPSPSLSGNQVVQENVVEPEAASSFAQRVRRFGKCAGEKEAAFLGVGGKAVKKCGSGSCSSPVSVSMKPAAVAARTGSRRRMGKTVKKRGSGSSPVSVSKKCSTAMAKAYDAPLLYFSEERDDKVRAKFSSPYDDADQSRQERRGDETSSRKRTMRSVAMEEAMVGLPGPGEGRVKYLVHTFERLLSLAGGGPEARSRGARRRRRKNEATPTARKASESSSTPTAADEIDVSYPSIVSSSEVSFPAIAGVPCILDASDRTSRIRAARDQRRQRQRRCDSTGWSERSWSRKVVTRVTSLRPFNLRTEQRGRVKEENFVQRMRRMQLEEERMRNPLAQGLPYTTDEPENPAKPPMKEPTEPIDLVLHSDVRAVGRAKFDHQVAERSSFLEEVKLAKERQQKVDEEIEIKQLRKEQVPRAHPMPDFTRPFVPKRSVKPQTIPREPKFHPRLMRHVSKA
ncbi:microtubule-destabilizing protein 60-like isoform X2 [Phragmites australis]|uniref:microtubule-destabilizing protein 60-like isoform X2 n=1 Tax=Phragmites australis TaxID=29695 RepID=UPI002D794F2A|nr:microtubule-destabilizing protein 60-like isoform X2 [Phragmites australis]